MCSVFGLFWFQLMMMKGESMHTSIRSLLSRAVRSRAAGVAVALLAALAIVVQGLAAPAAADVPAAAMAPLRAPAVPMQVDAKITKFNIRDLDKKTTTEQLYDHSQFYLAMDWDASANGANIREGDYFDIKLPDAMRFPVNSSAANFDLYDTDKNVVATGRITPGPGGDNHDAGGTVRVTFTAGAENRHNVKGTMYLAAYFEKSKIKRRETNTFTVSINGEVSSHGSDAAVRIIEQTDLPREVLGKFSGVVTGNKHQAQWYVRINHNKRNLTKVVVTDELQGGTETYDITSFKLEKVDFNSKGIVTNTYTTVDTSTMLAFSSDRHSFTLNLGNVPGDQYQLTYRSTYTPGSTLKNKLTLTSTEQSKAIESEYHAATSGGTANGDLASKIKLTKVDADDRSVVLAGAVFTVTRPNGSTFELTTGADGTVTSDSLEQGTYKVKEETAPNGYGLNDEEYTLEVTPTGGALLTITDKPVKTTVKVNKKWVGPEGDAVTVHLLADGADTGKTRTLNKAGSWAGTFENLRKYKPGTYTEIVYKVSEDPVDNYSSEVSGDAAAGFTVTNTNTETVAIKGTKTWDDGEDRDGMRPKEIKIHLLADGAEVSSKTVAAAANWSWLFADRPKYAADGHEIAYTVTEDAVPGYATKVDGFNVTNTRTPGKTSVTVTKAWDDADDQDGIRPASVKVQLYANGTASGDPVTLDEGHRWTHTWTGLFQKEGGQDVVYTVRELDAPAGYTSAVSGSAPEGFTVTNSHTPETINIPVTKKWVGPEGDSATVRLYADGADTGKALTLDKAGSWAGEFTDLPKFKGGREIAYTVKEDAVPDYSSAVSGDAAAGFTVTNTYTPVPKVPSKQLAKTGASNVAVVGVVGSLLVVVGGVLIALKRRRHDA